MALFTDNRIIKPDVAQLYDISNNPASSPNAFFSKYHLLPVPSWASTNEHGLLGIGAFSAYFRCINRSTGIEYAVKIFRHRQLTKSNKINVKETLVRETDALGLLQGHLNIVQLIEVIIDAEHYYIVTELLRGGSLSVRIMLYRFSFPEDKAKAVFRQLLSAVEYMHSKGVVHLDLKPDNVIFECQLSDSVKLVDFGFADSTNGMSLMKKARGTFTYAAPEMLYQFIVRKAPNLLKAEKAPLFRTDGYDSRCDLWSLGATLFSMLTGDVPFRWIVVKDPILYANAILEEMASGYAFKSVQPAEANSLLAGLLAVHPANRMTIEQIKEHPWLVEAKDQRDEADD